MPEENLTAKITVDTSQVGKAVSKAKRELAKLKDKTVVVKVKTQPVKGGKSSSSGGGSSRGTSALDQKALAAARAIGLLGKKSQTASITLKDLAATARLLRRALERLRDSAKGLNKAIKTVNRNAGKKAVGNKGGGKADTDNTENNGNGKDKSKQKTEQQNLHSLRKFTKALVATIAAISLVRDAYRKLSGSLKTAADYHFASLTTGLSVERLGQWKSALIPYGGDDSGATGDMMAIQRNLEAARRGEDPFSTAARQLMGDSLNVRPGMTQEEFIKQIAPRLQQLNLDEALRAGRDIGLSDAMIHLLRKPDWENELESQVPIVKSDTAKNAAETMRGTKRAEEYANNFTAELATKLLGWLDGNNALQATLGVGGTIIGAIAEATKTICTAIIAWKLLGAGGKFLTGVGAAAGGKGLFTTLAGLFGTKAAAGAVSGGTAAGATASGAAAGGAGIFSALLNAFLPATVGAVGSRPILELVAETARNYGFVPGGHEPTTVDGRPIGDLSVIDTVEGEKPRNLPEQTPEQKKRALRYQQILLEGGTDEEIRKKLEAEGFASAMPADTPLNYMDNSSARLLGSAAGRGETSVDVGGVVININAPSGNAEDIQNAVARGNAGAAEVVRQEFEKIDRENASTIIA